MSLAPPKHRPSSELSFDLNYSITDFEVSPHRDNTFLVARTEAVLLQEVLSSDGPALDVACGVGALTAQLAKPGTPGYGIDPSAEMLGLGVLVEPRRRRLFIRGVAESLPLRDGSFASIVCEGALDHFVHPNTFMTEARRVLRPGGKLVIALANYESLSCRVGRATKPAGRNRRDRPYWQPPPDHHHRGSTAFVQQLGAGVLPLERSYGVSMLWLLPGWGKALDRLPQTLTEGLLRALDRIAARVPSLADVIVSVWRKEAL